MTKVNVNTHKHPRLHHQTCVLHLDMQLDLHFPILYHRVHYLSTLTLLGMVIARQIRSRLIAVYS